MSMGLSTGSDIMNAGRNDPELAHHWKKIDKYEALEEWAKSFPLSIGLPLAKYFGSRKRTHERAYAVVTDEY